MKYALLLLLVLSGCQQAAPQHPTDVIIANIAAGIAHYKKDSVVMEYAITSEDSPETKDCHSKGWPDTSACRRISLGIVRTLNLYLDNKLPGVPRPAFPGASK